jgi:hypothetical protein
VTPFVLNTAASRTNKAVSIATKPAKRALRTPKSIQSASRKLNRAHKSWKASVHDQSSSPSAKLAVTAARKDCRQAIRMERLQNNLARDQRLHCILTDSPSSLYSYLRGSKATNQTCIEKLSVGDKIYLGDKVPDGFYDSMTSLKSCDCEQLLQNTVIAEQFFNYEHILKLCKNKKPVPAISRQKSEWLLSRIKKNVADFHSITASHYIDAGEEGISHFEDLLNLIITDVNNASAEELNVAHGLILHKGHKKEKTSDRAYRTISSCPFLAKSLDLYLRDLYQEQWDDCQASTQS